MTSTNNRNNGCGPFITCGAAAVSFDHKPGEPTSIDKALAAIKRFMKHETRNASVQSSSEPLKERAHATARGF